MLSWVIAFVGIAFLVVLHEMAGHFLFARLMGMKVVKASLFFPPYIWKKQRGETTYQLGILPLA
jgi:regulator of sigma E protease